MPSAFDLGVILALGVGIAIAIELAKIAFRTKESTRNVAAYAQRG